MEAKLKKKGSSDARCKGMYMEKNGIMKEKHKNKRKNIWKQGQEGETDWQSIWAKKEEGRKKDN